MRLSECPEILLEMVALMGKDVFFEDCLPTRFLGVE